MADTEPRPGRVSPIAEWTWIPAGLVCAVPVLAAAAVGTEIALAALAVVPVVLGVDRVLGAHARVRRERRAAMGTISRARRCVRIADAEDGELVVVTGVTHVVEGVRCHRTGALCGAYFATDLTEGARAECGRLVVSDGTAIAEVAPARPWFASGARGVVIHEGDAISIVGRARHRTALIGDYRGGVRSLSIEPADGAIVIAPA